MEIPHSMLSYPMLNVLEMRANCYSVVILCQYLVHLKKGMQVRSAKTSQQRVTIVLRERSD